MKKIYKDIIKNLPKKPFSLKEVMHLRVTAYLIASAIKAGHVEKVDHGLYRIIQKKHNQIFDTAKFEKVSARAKDPSCICLWSALYYYDLIEEMVDKVWIYVPYQKNVRDKDARAVRKRDADWVTGVVQKDGFKITSIERTIIDCFLSKKHISLKDSIDIAKVVIREKKSTFSKLVSMAKEMGVYNQIRQYLGMIT